MAVEAASAGDLLDRQVRIDQQALGPLDAQAAHFPEHRPLGESLKLAFQRAARRADFGGHLSHAERLRQLAGDEAQGGADGRVVRGEAVRRLPGLDAAAGNQARLGRRRWPLIS